MIIQGKTAFCTRAEFKSLPEYSLSLPTGPKVGFQWKRALYKPGFGQMVESGKWMLGVCEGEFCRFRELLVIEDLADAALPPTPPPATPPAVP